MEKKIIVIILSLSLVMTSLIASSTGNDKERQPEWIEDFDSYSLGQVLDGTPDDGGWKGWENNSLYGASVTNIISHSSPHSVDIEGDSDLVHEFSGYTAGQWVFTAWQYVPNDFVGESYFILLDIYTDSGTNNNWATQIQFNGTTDVVESQHENIQLPLIRGQWVELRNVINLDNDTQYFYYNGTLLTNKSWTEGVSGGGVLDIAAVDLFANGASTIYYDDISLRPPYTLSINIVGNGTVTKNPDQVTYLYNTPVELTAIPDTNWTFSHWSGDLTGGNNPEILNMTENKTVTAHFIPEAITLNIDLYPGWNLITVPCGNTLSAETLGQNISGCNLVLRFNASTQGFETYVMGSGYDNFPIQDGVGYFVRVPSNTVFNCTGMPISSVNVTVYERWNTLGWFHDYLSSARSLAGNTSASLVLMFNVTTQDFMTYVWPSSYDNFIITRGMGVFIRTSTQSYWHGEG